LPTPTIKDDCMARKPKSAFNDMIYLASLLPPWLGLLLALASWFGLHQLSLVEVVPPASGEAPTAMLKATLLKGFATFAQYVVPAIFVLGSLLSLVKRLKRNQLAVQTQARGNASALLDMSWQEFEQLVSEVFRACDYSVSETGGGGADGGVDLELRKGSELSLVQCKQWRAQKVGVETVRELYGVMAARGATGGFVVSAGSFSKDAKAFAEGRNIELLDGDALMQLLEAYGPAVNAETKQTPVVSTPPSAAPACPRCGAQMLKRVASKGANAGQAFWGCARFPSCRGTMPA
jgi:restriction system protein